MILPPPISPEEVAHNAWEAGHLRRAYRLFLDCAQAGSNHREAMLCLGYFYDEGLGVKQDKVLAMRWYKRAYRRGSWAAATNIAILYREQQRPALSYRWYFRAAKLGDGDAEVDIAKHLLEGKGVRRSIPAAIAALKRAARATPCWSITEDGHEEATALLFSLRKRIKRS